MLEIRTFTPNSLSEALAKCKITADEKQLLRVHGIIQEIQPSKSDRPFDNFCRGKLRDAETGQLLNIKVKCSEDLKNFDECILEGRLEDWIPLNANSEIKISLYFNVNKVITKGTYKLNEKEIKIVQRKIELVDLCSHKIHKNITSILIDLIEHRQQPKIAVIYGRKSYTWEDIEKSLKGSEKNYKFIPCEANLSDPKELIKNLQKLNEGNFHLIFLYRGGGDNLDVFNNLDLAECVINLKTPFATAIGHAQDHPFIQMMADRVFETPTAFGNYLQKCSRDAYSLSQRLKESTTKEENLLRRIENLNEQNTNLQTSVNRLADKNTPQIISKQNVTDLHNKISISLNKFLEIFERRGVDLESKLVSGIKQPNTQKNSSEPRLLLFVFLGIVIGVFASFSFPYLRNYLPLDKIQNIVNTNSNTSAPDQFEGNNSLANQNINVNSKVDRNNRRQKN